MPAEQQRPKDTLPKISQNPGLGLMAKANRQSDRQTDRRENTDRNEDVASSGFKCKWFMSSKMWAKISGPSRIQSQKLAKRKIGRKPEQNSNFQSKVQWQIECIQYARRTRLANIDPHQIGSLSKPHWSISSKCLRTLRKGLRDSS